MKPHLLAAAATLCGMAGSNAVAATACRLENPASPIQHVVYLEFDNVHLVRDNPNVPSDLEQMPHLLNFLRTQGSLQANNHTVLISHTASGILTAVTGLYPDKLGTPITNSFRYFKPDGTSSSASDFVYWTDPVQPPGSTGAVDTTKVLLGRDGKNAPAPWVAYTRAGCNVGAVAINGMALENVTTDLVTVFGVGSPQVAEGVSNPKLATADFEGIAVHCAAGAATCGTGAPDVLPDERGGYSGYNALYGHKSVLTALIGSNKLTDLLGNPIQDSSGNAGFPGFDGMFPAVKLSYVATMLEKGVPVVYGYLSDAHDNHSQGGTFGPGESAYVAQLAAYDAGFKAFFERLYADGINPSNTLFVVTADEGDHFVGGPPSPSNCDGVTTPCTYSNIGEIDADLSRLLATQAHVATPFSVHSDSAPAFYVNGNPSRTDPALRRLETASAGLTALDAVSGTTTRVTEALADRAEFQVLHMVAADPLRVPNFVLFANPDFFLFSSGQTSSCNTGTPCAAEEAGFAWNHGDYQSQIATSWLGMVGPGVLAQGRDDKTWSDHVDVRPTMLALTGLHDDYLSDGRMLAELMDPHFLPSGVAVQRRAFIQLAAAYKQLNAPFGAASLASLKLATKGIAASDATYALYAYEVTAFTAQRNQLAARIAQLLDAATFHHAALPALETAELTAQAQGLIAQMNSLASTLP